MMRTNFPNPNPNSYSAYNNSSIIAQFKHFRPLFHHHAAIVLLLLNDKNEFRCLRIAQVSF